MTGGRWLPADRDRDLLFVVRWPDVGPSVGGERQDPAPARTRCVTGHAWRAYSYVAQGAMFLDGVDPYRHGASSYGGVLAANRCL